MPATSLTPLEPLLKANAAPLRSKGLPCETDERRIARQQNVLRPGEHAAAFSRRRATPLSALPSLLSQKRRDI
jgi:hypothetical protein